MANRTVLDPDDREFLDGIIEAHVNGDVSIRVTSVGPTVTADLQRLAEQGDDQAGRILSGLATDGANERVKVFAKNKDRTTFKVARSGHVINVPSRVGHRARSETGEKIKAFQQTLWYELTWAEFKTWLEERMLHRDHLSAVIESFGSVLELEQRFPDTRTPLEACERAGIDPRAFNVGEAA